MITETIINTYGKSQAIDSDCVSIAFRRPTGTNPFQVNGIPIEDGQTMTISQNVGDIDSSKYIITFQAGAGVNECIVVKIVPKNGGAYSDSIFNIDNNTSKDKRYINVPLNVVMELKYPNTDIKGTVL